MSEIIATSAIVTTIKNVFELLRGVKTAKNTVFENVIKPMHAEAESSVTDYYKFFHFLDRKICTRSEDYTDVSSDDLSEIEALYSEGKAKRDGLRALAKVIIEDAGMPRIVVRYCEAVDCIFIPIISAGYPRWSAARRFIDITKLFTNPSLEELSYDQFKELVEIQIRRTEERWVAACQMYASICLRAYRL